MRICIYEDAGSPWLEPIALTRPAFALWCGAERLFERQRRQFAATEVGYWVLPKPADLGILLYHAMHAESFARELSVFEIVQQRNQFYPQLSVLASLLSTLLILAVAARQFVLMDY